MAATKTEAKESVLTDRTIQESMTTESAFNITPLLKSASVPSGYKYIDTIGATKYGETKLNNMEVYYSRVYDGVTTYSITSYKGSIAALALSLVVSLAIPQLAASEFISELIKYGLGSLVGSVLSINSSRTFAATEYVYHYFGSDIGSSKCAYWKNAGSEYYIIDKNYTSAKTTYYDNYTYTGSTSDNIFWDICDTLAYRVYGASCELDF